MNKKFDVIKKKHILITAAVYLLIIAVWFFAAYDKLMYTEYYPTAGRTDNSQYIGEITDGVTVSQSFMSDYDEIRGFSIVTATYNRTNYGSMFLDVYDQDGQLLERIEKPADEIANDTATYFEVPEPIRNVYKKALTLTISSDMEAGTAATVYYGDSDNYRLREATLNKKPVEGAVLMYAGGLKYRWFGQNFWFITIGVLVLLTGYMCYLYNCQKEERDTFGLKLIRELVRYRFLLSQLVAKDFKTKYKRSVLGVLWSLLNPLLTMFVQYVVFSTIFRMNIENYSVYLLSGIVMFNFFNEAVSQSLGSIVSNANLITKVCSPRYIYPVSKVLSSGINFLFTLIPLTIFIIITGVPITPALILFPYCVVTLLIFNIGLGMLLSAVMVFFRDTQFLWGVISMLWMYATPIFYPEDILPEKFMALFRLNPMYHYIGFARTVILHGTSPDIFEYIWCFVWSAVMLAAGALVFRKCQNKFAMYI